MVSDARPKEICNEYAIQTMFCQSQTYPTENKPFFISRKKARISKSGFKKAKLATLQHKN